MSRDLDALALRVQLPAFPGTTVTTPARRLLDEGLGGVCLFGSNTADGPDAVSRFSEVVHSHGPVVVAVDEEGGEVTRLHAGKGSPYLGAATLGVLDDLDLTRDTAAALGAELASLGVTMTLGPVADVNSDPDNPVIGVRSFGTDPQRVAAHVAAWVSGCQSAGPAACAKHFPGHGDTRQDSHVALPVVTAGRDLLERRELVPFDAAVAAGVAAVMTSHIVVPALDHRAATFSPVVLGLLRERGFEGALVSDALDMAGASAGTGIPAAAVRAVAAGVDLLCLGADKDEALVRAVQAALVDAVRRGDLPVERLADAAARVDLLATREQGPADARPGTQPEAWRAAAGRALVREGRLPTLDGAEVVTVRTEANIAVGDVPWGVPPDRSYDAGALPAVPPGPPLVVQVRDAHRHPAVLAWLAELVGTGATVVLVEWGWAAPLPAALDAVPRLVPHGSTLPTVAAVADALRQAGWQR